MLCPTSAKNDFPAPAYVYPVRKRMTKKGPGPMDMRELHVAIWVIQAGMGNDTLLWQVFEWNMRTK